jgi:hypothetical protein
VEGSGEEEVEKRGIGRKTGGRESRGRGRIGANDFISIVGIKFVYQRPCVDTKREEDAAR